MSVKEQREIKIAFAKSVAEQITALNRSLAQAEKIGLRIDLSLRGYNRESPEIRAIYDVGNKKDVSLYGDVFLDMRPQPTDERG